jgi:hypothetical protein
MQIYLVISCSISIFLHFYIQLYIQLSVLDCFALVQAPQDFHYPTDSRDIAEWRVIPRRFLRRVAGTARGQVTTVHAFWGQDEHHFLRQDGAQICQGPRAWKNIVFLYVIGIDDVWIMY